MSDVSEKIETVSEQDEPITHCEGCSKPIYDGDSYHTGSDVDLCADCAPAFSDLLASPESFADSEGEPLTPEAATALYDAHIAAGGAPTDKIGIPTNQG